MPPFQEGAIVADPEVREALVFGPRKRFTSLQDLVSWTNNPGAQNLPGIPLPEKTEVFEDLAAVGSATVQTVYTPDAPEILTALVLSANSFGRVYVGVDLTGRNGLWALGTIVPPVIDYIFRADPVSRIHHLPIPIVIPADRPFQYRTDAAAGFIADFSLILATGVQR